MKADPRFANLDKEFWAHVRTISQAVGYVAATGRATGTTNPVKVPNVPEIMEAFRRLNLHSDHLIHGPDRHMTAYGQTFLDYFSYRASVLNAFVESHLMSAAQAAQRFLDLYLQLKPTCYIPMNKQKGEKKAPQFFTGIINTLVEANAEGLPCDYNPGALTTVTRDGIPVRTLSRRVDGAFTSTINPVAIWEVKEYYYTTTFGSRVADGVYETLVDGMELEELRKVRAIDIQHVLMVDAYFTWWIKGRSYLCRLVDLLHMGYVDEILFGSEVLERMPVIVKEWANQARIHPELVTARPISPQQAKSFVASQAQVTAWVAAVRQHPEMLNESQQQEVDAQDDGDATDEVGDLDNSADIE